MADNKKYYYMRLKEDFFDSDEIKILEASQDGYLYSNILLKMYLRSLKGEGKLMVNDAIPYNSQMIATVTGHQVGTVERALKLFETLGLIEIIETGAIYMLNIQNFIGKSNTEADRKREYRKRIEDEKTWKNVQISSADWTNVPQNGTNVLKMSPRDREREKERNRENVEIEKEYIYCREGEETTEKNKKRNLTVSVIKDDNVSNFIKTVIEYLNAKADKHYKATTPKTKTVISARMKEGFTLDDFKKVIDTKVTQWKNSEMDKFLRPETLFGTKFEGYLNESTFVKKSTQSQKAVELNSFYNMAAEWASGKEDYDPTTFE